MEKKLLGIIAGNGKFPMLFARKAKAKGFNVVAAGIKGDTSFFLRFFVDEYMSFHAGELKNLFLFLEENGIKKAVMAGQVSQRNLFKEDVKLDEEFKELFNAIKDRKADTIFSAIADKLKQHGIELINSVFLLDNNLAPKGTLTKRGPSLNELSDIEFGIDIAKQSGKIDIGQTVIIKDKAIVAIEAMEGTDQTIIRGGRIARQGAVIVKVSKPEQDLRFDVPVIGPRTIKNMIKVKASCLAVEAKKTLIIDPETCIRLANKSNICIIGA